MIRKALTTDLDQLVVLFEAYRTFYNKPIDIVGAKDFLESRLSQLDSEIFVAVDNEQLVGFVQLYPLFSSTRMKKYWLLNDLFVDEDYRGKGFSKGLIEATKTVCQSTDACGILLETGKENTVGNQLYPSCGFQLYDEVNFYEWTNPKI